MRRIVNMEILVELSFPRLAGGHSIDASPIERLSACSAVEGSEWSGNVPADFASDSHSTILGGGICRVGTIGRSLPLARKIYAGISSDDDRVP